ncbi:hypothetical protein [Aquipseudomonas alcaligenes]|uniref:Uncharacterized protein n=1 Tax=Aquipseudomonas alcaligenes (strain ATCC 14909 / DSM 50342 / CCUG 1425 / JCM 20561 / NBRC 14159 / NCIMB 9945 / NCTC 10367 / 1577) TaxID=1215092 RepID=U2ZVI5_AQUA1|nr:hypothetical protein [Pseudomonas alcaligenes]GAD65112.1 hypothetical protein PA6_070_00060 [Pseudomonas alcaligenes NBRC 14159]
MNSPTHAGIQAPTEPFNFRSPGVNPSLNGREAISWQLLQTFNRHEMPGKTGEVPVPASRHWFFTALNRASRSTSVLPCGASGYRRNWSAS